MGIYYYNNNDIISEEFDLKEAIKNNEVDLIFGESIELLEESYKHEGKNNMKMLLRNQEQDKINHEFTMKFIPNTGDRRDDKNFNHEGKYGLPITIDPETMGWNVWLGDSREKEAIKIKKDLTKREKKFISELVDKAGKDIIEYFYVKNIDTEQGKKKLNTIVKRIKDKML